MKECKYCRTIYEDSLSACPNCGGTKVITALEKAEDAALYQKEIENRENAVAVVASKRKMLISVLVGIVVLIIAVIAIASYNANKPLSNGMTKDEGEAVLAEGISFYNSKDYESAIECFVQLPSDSKQYDEAQSMLAKCEDEYSASVVGKANGYAENGEYEMAINMLKNVRELLPNNAAISTAYDTIFAEYKDVICTNAFTEAEEFVSNADYPSAITTIDTALTLVGNSDELVAKKTVYYNEYKILAFQAIDKAYSEGGYESAISLINSYQTFFSNDSDFNEKNQYYETLKPISLFSLSTYKTSGTWGITYYPSYDDALGKSHDDVYINSGTSLGLAPGAAMAQYYIESKYKELTGEIAFASNSGNGYIEILSGDTIIYTSPSVSGIDGSIAFSVDISGVDFLGIRVRSGRNTGWGSDNWNCNSVMLIGIKLRK